ncbi:hypothetical protein [Streptomyces sp. NBC_00347]|uniref:hypothetical protein n=1 Tax=Streptomyces sp. NBC_00347 TaxID=2975721 RepID=UPI00225C3305|nr:hypothetical protein [Streptomyces sp. NBC_00347]MCX5130013.1 hypothetical protein [Streptomyces sp. NBC_00347]
MFDRLNYFIDLVAHGLLTELPAQLVTAAAVAVGAAALRALRRRRPRKADNGEV